MNKDEARGGRQDRNPTPMHLESLGFGAIFAAA